VAQTGSGKFDRTNSRHRRKHKRVLNLQKVD
jgi:hypothetical protein